MSHTVMTVLGRLEGELGAQGVTVFRGIPYAKPPLGALRFRAPAPLAPWSGTRDARRFGCVAPQDRGLVPDLPEQGEDCLTLNVWTPACDTARRPVMVWIHGGSFTIGSGAQDVYDGSTLARMGDVVVVTINYRLGALGFSFLNDVLGPRAEVASNAGLRDQIAALRWVSENIAQFGGDPENVTIFGESAGGMSVGALLSAPEARGLFRRAVAQSGAAHHVTTRAEASRMAEVLLRGLGVSAQHPERLWSVAPEELVVAQRLCSVQTILRGPRGLQLPQGAMTLIPVAEGDLLPEDPFDAIAQGAAREVDLLVGSTLDEWNYFLFIVEPQKRGIDESVLQKLCEKRIPGRGADAIALYRQVLGPALAPAQLYSAIETDRMFGIPALRLAQAHAGHGARTFMYLFDWQSPLFDGELGACHAVELPFVFGTVHTAFGRAFAGDSPQAQQLADVCVASWAAFARNGDPSCAELGSWPRFDPQLRDTMRLSASCRVERAPLDVLRAFWDGVQ